MTALFAWLIFGERLGALAWIGVVVTMAGVALVLKTGRRKQHEHPSARHPLRRDSYRHFHRITTRWMDNDAYGHVNNVVYYSWFDTVVNEYLIRAGVLDITGGAVIGLVVETQCRYFSELSFPQPVDLGLRIGAARHLERALRDRRVRRRRGRPRAPRATSSTSTSIARRGGRPPCRRRCAPLSRRIQA